jgi:hypothetical protein
MNSEDSPSPLRFLFADARQSCSAHCFIRQVDAVVRRRERRLAVASFTIGDDHLIDGS